MDQQTVDAYNQMATEYDKETTDFWNLFPRTFIDRFAEMTTGTVLDIGSGPGRDALLFREKGLDVVCLDASSAMVEMSTQRGFTSVLGDFLHLPFPDHSFSSVWAYTSLLHIPKNQIDSAFDEIERVLQEDGILGLGMILGEGELYRESTKVHQPRWFSYYSEEELLGICARHGFDVVHTEQFQPGQRMYMNIIARHSSPHTPHA